MAKRVDLSLSEKVRELELPSQTQASKFAVSKSHVSRLSKKQVRATSCIPEWGQL